MKKKLSSWKVNFMTTAGRTILMKSTLNTIPAYTMQYFLLPKKICYAIDNIQRDFLWGSSTHKKKLHYVTWENVTSPKDNGGLGLQSAETKNNVLLTGLAWRFFSNNFDL